MRRMASYLAFVVVVVAATLAFVSVASDEPQPWEEFLGVESYHQGRGFFGAGSGSYTKTYNAKPSPSGVESIKPQATQQTQQRQNLSRPSTRSTDEVVGVTVNGVSLSEVLAKDQERFEGYVSSYQTHFGDTSIAWSNLYRREARYFERMAESLSEIDPHGFERQIKIYIELRDAMLDIATEHDTYMQPVKTAKR